MVTGLFFAVLFSTAHAQTLSDIEKKYGAPVRAYSANEHIWMTPECGLAAQRLSHHQRLLRAAAARR
jgi:hypothetical protein